MKEANPKAIYLKDYQPPQFLIEQVELLFLLEDQGTRVRARLSIRRHPDSPNTGQGLRLNGEGLKSIWLKVDGQELAADAYHIDQESLTLHAPAEAFVLESEVEIAPEQNTALEGLYRSSGMFCTQCEAEGFRKITWYLDRPDVMATFTTRIEADRAQFPVLLSNGNPAESGELPNGRHFATWQDPFPKPCYLFALVAGDLRWIQDQHITPSGRTIDLRIYVEPENIKKCDHAMRSLIHAMKWDEQQYGREYDLDVYNIVAVNDFNMGAMENKGLNVFNSKYVLAQPETATDQDYQGIEGVIAHEYFHNWTGNRVTCRDWFQLSLKEGLTVFRDQEFSADMGSRGVKRIDDVRLLRAHQFSEDAGPMAHPVRPASYIEINNFYTVTVYEKGAEVVRMQANLLGKEAFRRATDLYFQRHDGQAVTTDDFVRSMADASGKDLTQFKHWYDVAGTPVLDVQTSFDQADGCYQVVIKQSVPDSPDQQDKPAFHIPFAMGLLDAQGRDIPLQLSEGEDHVSLELRERKEIFRFTGISERPVPSFNRGFSAPVKVNYQYRDEELMFLMAHDQDGFNRWDASQTLAQRMILSLVADRTAGRNLLVSDDLIKAYRAALIGEGSDKALIAELLVLPSESYLGDQMQEVDVEGLAVAREFLKRQIAAGLHDDLLAVYEQSPEAGDYRPEPDAIGRRRLKNTALGYLMSGGTEDAIRLCLDQYAARHNMTDVMTALSLIADSDISERPEILKDFSTRWSDDPLVMDKWFSVQAVSRREDTLVCVESLMQHPTFSMNNPNKVRALIGAFVNGNPQRFHASDGTGYAFLVDRVLELDPVNPQIAARLLRVMSRWRRYDAVRQEKMHGQLERVVAVARLSRDAYEVASKSLEG